MYFSFCSQFPDQAHVPDGVECFLYVKGAEEEVPFASPCSMGGLCEKGEEGGG